MRLALEGVRAGYGEAEVLHGVDLVAPRGMVTALLGANGAGKTTLLRVAAGLSAPSAGRVALDGADITAWPAHRRARAGLVYVPGDAGTFRSLTVRQNLELQAPPGAPDPVGNAVSAFPPLCNRLGQLANRLSGGEQQMLALGRAHQPEVTSILLDEVSLGLAPAVVDQILGTLRDLASQGRSVLVVEQYVTKALDLADLVYVLHHGQITFAGQPAELIGSDLLAHYFGANA